MLRTHDYIKVKDQQARVKECYELLEELMTGNPIDLKESRIATGKLFSQVQRLQAVLRKAKEAPNWDVLRRYTFDQVQDLIAIGVFDEDKGKFYAEYEGRRVSLRRAIIHFEIGHQCVRCSRQGVEYRLEDRGKGGLHLDLYSGDGMMMTIDHIHPRSKGGSNTVDNYQMMCELCNSRKGNTLEES